MIPLIFSQTFQNTFLLFSLLLFLGGKTLFAQDTNEVIYQKLLLDFQKKHPESFKAIEGRFFRDYLPQIEVDTNQQEVLRFEGFSIQYNPLGKKSYLRSIEIPISLQGKALRQEVMVYADTLSSKQVRKVIKGSLEPFKGEDPTKFSRWIQPAGLISASVLALVGLFFIRG